VTVQKTTKKEKVEMKEFKMESNNNVSNGMDGNLRHSNNITNGGNMKKGNFPSVQKTTVEVIVDRDNRTSVRPPTSRSSKVKVI
jgi:hypothetical protein